MTIDVEKKEFAGWWMWILMLVVTSGIIFTTLNYFGIIGKTVVERAVFEQSYQKKAGDKQKIAIFKAQLAEITRKLSNPELNNVTRSNLEASASSIRIQLNAARSVQ